MRTRIAITEIHKQLRRQITSIDDYNMISSRTGHDKTSQLPILPLY